MNDQRLVKGNTLLLVVVAVDKPQDY